MGPLPFAALLVVITAGISIADQDITPFMFASGYLLGVLTGMATDSHQTCGGK